MRLITLVLLALPTATAAQTADPAASAINAYHTQVTRVAASGASLKARADRYMPVVADAYDLPAALSLVAGGAAASATPADRAAALNALQRHSAVAHATNFKSAGLKFTVDPKPVARGADRLVRTTVAAGSGAPTTLVYRLRQTAGRWKIVDVVASGVSQLAVQRSDFAASLKTGGLPGLTKRLAEVDAKSLG